MPVSASDRLTLSGSLRGSSAVCPSWTNGAGPNCADQYSAANPSYPYCPNKVFQFHHQPLNYFANYAPGTTARAQHLRDEAEFMSLAQTSTEQKCNLNSVSFVKPIGLENEHPGYTSEAGAATTSSAFCSRSTAAPAGRTPWSS